MKNTYLIIDRNTPCRYGAPTCLVVAFNKNNVFTYPGGKRDSGVEDACIVATSPKNHAIFTRKLCKSLFLHLLNG